uniref:Uncharacterized protein n=1 Tax=Pinguiococcus pyrenoidosus TaxID=172671 RepID=A0A7R9Y9J0_9STRA|eukprot:scaffold1554_cov261-Pinguiococcus_pyrenoidosus.AAC.13
MVSALPRVSMTQQFNGKPVLSGLTWSKSASAEPSRSRSRSVRQQFRLQRMHIRIGGHSEQVLITASHIFSRKQAEDENPTAGDRVSKRAATARKRCSAPLKALALILHRKHSG